MAVRIPHHKSPPLAGCGFDSVAIGGHHAAGKISAFYRRLDPTSQPVTVKFERKTEALLPFPSFVNRLACSLGLAFGVITAALGIGTIGYHEFAELSWIDSLLNASMILTGMGPIAPMSTTAAKLFATAYSLFSGVVFLSAVSLMLSPVFHRILHKFHLDDLDDEDHPKPD